MANAPLATEGGAAAPAPKTAAPKRAAPPKKASAPKEAPAKARTAPPPPRAARAREAEEDPVLAVQNRVARAAEERSQSRRTSLSGRPDGGGRLYIDPKLIPPGMEAQWVRESVHGERDDGNIEIALAERGFVAATTDQFPSLKTAELPDRRTNSNLIRRGGQILMLRPIQVGRQERMERKRADEATLRAVNKELVKEQDGKVIQGLAEPAVTTSVERSSDLSAADLAQHRFADA